MKDIQTLLDRFQSIRRRSEELCETLETEDYVIQAIADVSPPKWHLAHTTWFFEAFLLSQYRQEYQPVCPEYGFLFNSYYNAIGEQWHRPSRGHLSRPTVRETMDYRRRVNESVLDLFSDIEDRDVDDLSSLLELGLNHEQQHQELLLTDIKYNFSINPLRPVLRKRLEEGPCTHPGSLVWIDLQGDKYTVGHTTAETFCFDNELPCHEVLLQNFRMANRLTTCAEYVEFIEDGGYQNPQLWLSDGWDFVCREGWTAPLYWEKLDDTWGVMTLSGFREISVAEPVCHISYFEADAFATWAGKRLLTEFEWEVAAKAFSTTAAEGNFAEEGLFHPRAAAQNLAEQPVQMLGDVWEWTASAYLPYPGFRTAPGAVGEYNGKFMSGQMVLRGGSTATPRDHIRQTYRNFFQPEKRWQFSGIRLGESA